MKKNKSPLPARDEGSKAPSRRASLRLGLARADTARLAAFFEHDPLPVRELFENLPDNAADAVPESGGRIEIDTAAAEPGRCLVRISDTGPGLAVCRQIANLHGGEISLDSELGRGTTVTVSLHRTKVDE